MIGLCGTTQGEPDKGYDYDAKAAEWRAELPPTDHEGQSAHLHNLLFEQFPYPMSQGPLCG